MKIFVMQSAGIFPMMKSESAACRSSNPARCEWRIYAIYGSHKVNGVARLHTDILKSRIFHDFYEMAPEKFINVTNGVTQRRWLFMPIRYYLELITERIGRYWIRDFHKIARAGQICRTIKKRQKAFLEIKRQNKQTLIDFLTKENPIRDEPGTSNHYSPSLSPMRFLMCMSNDFMNIKDSFSMLCISSCSIMRSKIRSVDSIPRFSIFGGKAAAGYERAKQIIPAHFCHRSQNQSRSRRNNRNFA